MGLINNYIHHGKNQPHQLLEDGYNFVNAFVQEKYDTGSIPRCPLQSHALLCIGNYLFLIGIVSIHDKDLICIF